ncbi:hypothetical protein DP185_16400 [Enterobacter hormaechei]|uniref:hypothetical protein n=1 Tax=Enterobacter quasihormaechei TaxID=2529382 RepID=UPI000DCB91C9|nr:hypothetical protein DP185_16400 [Enterobacter hormaechei]
MSNIDKRALREELSNPAIGSNAHLRKLALALLDELEAAEKRIAELEAREVKLPERYEVDMCPTPSPDGDWYSREDVLAALAAAGLKVAAAGKGE